MRSIFHLIKFIVSTALVLAGTVTIVAAFALGSSYLSGSDPGGLLIEPGSSWWRPLVNPDVWGLYFQLQARAADINSPVSTDPSLVPITIAEGEPAQLVAEKLQALGLIGDADLFVQLLTFNGLDTRLQSGDFELRRTMTMRQVGAALVLGRSARLSVIIPPGWRLEQVATHVAANGLMDGNLFLQQARQGTVVSHPLLADRPAGQSYEGYLFPGTYYLPDSPTPADLIAQMLTRLAGQLPADTASLAGQQGLTFYQVLTLAAIVERETAIPEERPIVASVYLNRLRPGSGEPYLGADPTVQYALGYQAGTGQWWKAPLSLDEYNAVDSPYNTYRYPGLPPGPIASPSLAAILAVLQPAETDYLFFVCQRPGCEGGRHIFARTYEEHLQNVAVYWGQ